jgi:hypothetical protein
VVVIENVSLPVSNSQQIKIKSNNIEVKNINGLKSGKFRLNNGNYVIIVSD